MANQKQLTLLKQGTEIWNRWRNEHPKVEIDLSEADLSEADLSSFDLSRVDLSGANLNRANLSHTNMSGSNLSSSKIVIRPDGKRKASTDFKLTSVNLSEANLREANLSGANLRGANLRGADLRGADLSEAILSGSSFVVRSGEETDKHNITLEGTLRNTHLTIRPSGKGGTDLSYQGSDIKSFNLEYLPNKGEETSLSDLNTNVDITSVDLKQANLSHANLSRADLSGANLSEADLSYANLSRTNLSEADLNYANLTQATALLTRFIDVDLKDVQGLETVIHQGPSSIGIDTIYRSQGKIPENFLRKAGVPDSFLEIMATITNRPIE
jgi:uncharacterized protein YjbI with pentapeptide repeats